MATTNQLEGVAIITQARLGSTRLPNKIMAKVGGQTMLEYHLNRLLESDLRVIVATTDLPQDDVLADFAASLDFEVFRGSELDVLSRFAGAAQAFDLQTIIRCTSDCPLIDPDLILAGLDKYLGENNDRLYASNTLERTYPRGMDFEIFSRAMLEEANQNAIEPAHREHVTPYFYHNVPGNIALLSLANESPDGGEAFRLTLDEPADLELLTKLIEEHCAESLTCAEIVSLLHEHPELAAINAQVEQKKV